MPRCWRSVATSKRAKWKIFRIRWSSSRRFSRGARAPGATAGSRAARGIWTSVARPARSQSWTTHRRSRRGCRPIVSVSTANEGLARYAWSCSSPRSPRSITGITSGGGWGIAANLIMAPRSNLMVRGSRAAALRPVASGVHPGSWTFLARTLALPGRWSDDSERPMPLRILLAEDELIVRQGVKALLRADGFEVVGEASDGREVVQLAARLTPDVAVLDIAMPVLNGLDAARAVGTASSETRVVLLTSYRDEQHVLDALSAGVKGYVLKTQASADLAQAIRDVVRGATYLSPGVSRVVVDAYLE